MSRRRVAPRPPAERPRPQADRKATGASPGRDEQAIDLLRLLWALDHGLHVRSKLMARTLGITGAQRLAMRMIEQAPGILARDLVERLRVHKSTLSGILQRLESRSVVARQSDPDDGRKQLLAVTPAGLALLHRAAPTIEAEVTAVLAEFDPSQIEGLRRVLTRLAERLTSRPGRPPASTAVPSSGGRGNRVCT